MADDRTEIQDLAPTHPEKIGELAALWRDWADRCGVWDWDELQRHRRKKAKAK